MNSSFEFRINPRDCFNEEDANELYRALELADGRYLISWSARGDNVKGLSETFFTKEDVFESLAENSWIILEQE